MLRPRALYEDNFCGSRISSGDTEREVQLSMFASYRSLELALLFSIYGATTECRATLDHLFYMCQNLLKNEAGHNREDIVDITYCHWLSKQRIFCSCGWHI